MSVAYAVVGLPSGCEASDRHKSVTSVFHLLSVVVEALGFDLLAAVTTTKQVIILHGLFVYIKLWVWGCTYRGCLS